MEVDGARWCLSISFRAEVEAARSEEMVRAGDG